MPAQKSAHPLKDVPPVVSFRVEGPDPDGQSSTASDLLKDKTTGVPCLKTSGDAEQPMQSPLALACIEWIETYPVID